MPSKFQEFQRAKAISLIQSGNSVFDGAIGGRKYREENRDFILLDNIKNIYAPIREEVIKYFKGNNISWWGGFMPSGHVLSSQIACLNHLFLIRNDIQAVSSILKTINPDLIEPLLIETDKYSPAYIQFEAVSDQDHLYELTSTRGSNCTSVDVLLYARHKNGGKWLIPLEWKYTEFYNNQDKATEGFKKDPVGCKGEVRKMRYNNLILNSTQLRSENISWFYYEPFYQLMRQTLWAEQMIHFSNQETLKADEFMHVHVIPSENEDLLKKKYKCSGMEMEKTWRHLLKDQSKYKIITPQKLLSNLATLPGYNKLRDYLSIRYWN